MQDRLRTRALPWVAWAVTMGSAAWLWQDLQVGGGAVGFAAEVEYTVASPRLGRIADLAVAPGQEVRAGEVVATLEVESLEHEAASLAAERGRLEATLAAVGSEAAIRADDRARALDEALSSANLSLRSARSARAVQTAELDALDAQVRTLRGLVGDRMADRRELDALGVKRAGLRKEVAQADALIHELARQAADARARRAALPADAAERTLQPIHAELQALEVREEALALRRREAALRAPADGRVAAIHLRPGELADAGAPVVTLVGRGPDPGDDVVVCLRDEQAARVHVGEAVRLRPRGGGPGLPGHVRRLAPRIAVLPPRCRRNPALPEWGREAVVTLDEPITLLPGQPFTAAFLGDDPGDDPAFPGLLGEASAAPATTGATSPGAAKTLRGAPTPVGAPSPGAAAASGAPPGERPGTHAPVIEVPPALAARTRFEPSALLWLPQRGGFVVASDDTGLQGQEGEHAPWLFTMDGRGRVDPEPLIIAGLGEVRDLEALAPGPEDSIYILASQSASRRGKRSPAREIFARVAIDDAGARALASTSLAAALADADADALADLGLDGAVDLDLEGLCATRFGGLLIGLKAPLDADERAIVWHLPRPEALLAGRGVAEAGLQRHGVAPLAVMADGEARPGGIAELLELDDGSLLLAATASGDEPRAQSGALWHVAPGESLTAARLIRAFDGLKPEGLALRPDGQAIVIVFDTGAAAPRWMELPWPAP